ncbi:MAG: mechanosensitive ion channel family protein [Thermodesulfobacteriota bacterium]
MEFISNYINMTPEIYRKLIFTGCIFAILFILKKSASYLVSKRVNDAKNLYNWRHLVFYIYWILLFISISALWIRGLSSLTTLIGLTSAGLAIAMSDTIANIAGWFFIVWRKPFSIGDRIEIGGVKGDVIDIRFFQFSMVEVGNWIDADQSTGRVIHMPNSKVLREHLANYQIGFDYVWHEIPVLITFESNWKKAKEILISVANDKAEHLSKGAEEQIRRAAMKYMIYFKKLTPIVYTTVKDSGVMLTIRYIVKPRSRRGAEQEIWEAILEEFSKHNDIDLAYPTTRFYSLGEERQHEDRRV